MKKLKLEIRKRFYKVVNSIAFYPALIGFGFVFLSYIFTNFDFSDTGKYVKSHITWLTLKDSSTARSIVSAIVTGVISLTVFSFSMVMIVLNQAASNMSNRVLNKLIGNRFQQFVLGFYLGTIIYSLFVLATIRDYQSSLNIPTLSIYFLILLTIFDIFLFIYFLHFITQNVKFEVVIENIRKATQRAIKDQCKLSHKDENMKLECHFPILSKRSGIFTGFDEGLILEFCCKHDLQLNFIVAVGTYLLENTHLVDSSKELNTEQIDELCRFISLQESDSIDANYSYGFIQLTEIANRALSPGINDQGTAVLALRSIFQLLQLKSTYHAQFVYSDEHMNIRMVCLKPTFDSLFNLSITRIWQYGKNDYRIQGEYYNLLSQYMATEKPQVVLTMYDEVLNEIKRKDT